MMRYMPFLKSHVVALCCGALLLSATATAAPKVLLSDHFDGNSNNYAQASPWQSKYCADQWSTSLNGGVVPKTDHGCACGGGCDFAVYTQGTNKCVNSQAPDNMLVRGDTKWADYTYRVRLRNDDNDTMGVVFRYTNTANYYLLILSRDLAPSANACDTSLVGAQLIRVSATKGKGKAAVIATSKVTYQIGKVHLLQVTVIKDQITVHLDTNGDGKLSTISELLFTLNDGVHKSGMVGLYAYQNGAGENPCNKGGCWFDDVLVTEIAEGTVEPPKALDGDKDGVPDAKDNCPAVANAKQANKDGDKLGDACDDDADGDGLSNVDEAKIGAHPLDRDSDDDGVPDNKEALAMNDTDGDGKANIIDPDADGDGLLDGLEAGVVKPGPDTDVTAGNFISDLDPTTHTSMVKKDTDGDGRDDGVEDSNQNGRVDACESNPVVVDQPPCPAGSSGGNSSSSSSSGADSSPGGSGSDVIGDAAQVDPNAVDGIAGGSSGGGVVQLKEMGADKGGCAAARTPADNAPIQGALVLLGLLALGLARGRSCA
jgi:hypothetical protein